MTQGDLFPDALPPYRPGSATSLEAAAALRGDRRAKLRARVLDAIRELGGATDEQLAEYLRMNPSTERPRRIELVRAGLVRDSGEKRQARSGRYAVVWKCVEVTP